jgi:heat shock protein HslJ
MKWWLCVACLALTATIGAALAEEDDEFPLDGGLILDASPMPGNKRIPNMDIAADGKIVLEMWCNRVEGQVVVAGDTITVMTGPPSDRPCPPERTQADADLIAALNEVTNWRRQDDVVTLIGPKTLRFRVPTN